MFFITFAPASRRGQKGLFLQGMLFVVGGEALHFDLRERVLIWFH